ncbi:MAG: hypothetical protein D3922_06785 [Candidatus Electrothrix sp. AR1]|nr:hypothetical protein [Candidatus Electrothrix sp. AR1]
MKNALKKLKRDRFLTYSKELDAWDCHPLIRAYLCRYIFKDDRKARECHHQVALFYIDKLSENWKEPVQTFLGKLNHVSQEKYMDGDSENKTQKKKDKAKRDRRKTKWTNWKNENSEQADEDMELLQRAVYHFILAKELRNAWQLYWEWISIRKEYLLSRFFGLFQEDLSTLSYFFESPWSSIKDTTEENQKLSPDDIASLFDAVGFRLRSFSRLTEAHQASGGAFLEWHKAEWRLHVKISGDTGSLQTAVCILKRSFITQ